MKLTKQSVDGIGKEVLEAVRVVAEKYGMVVEGRGGRYSPEIGTFQPKFILKQSQIDGRDRDQVEFERRVGSFGLKIEDYGRTFENKGRTFKLVGISVSRRKYPIIGESVIGKKRMLFTTDVLRRNGFDIPDYV